MKTIPCNVQLGWYGSDNIRGPALFVIQARPIEICGYTFAVHYQLDGKTLEWNRRLWVVTDPVSGLLAASEKTKAAAIATATERIGRAVSAGMLQTTLANSAVGAKNLPVFVRPVSAVDRAAWRAENSHQKAFDELEKAAKKRSSRSMKPEARA
jgi:hypothetical protein